MSKKFAVILSILFLSTGCVGIDAPFKPPLGLIYTNVKAPLKTDLRGTNFNTNNGQAQTVTFQYGIWSFSVGDSSAKAAMMNAYIDQADYADYEYVNVLFGLYESVTVITYGQDKDLKSSSGQRTHYLKQSML